MHFLGILQHWPVSYFVNLFWVDRYSIEWQDVTQKNCAGLKKIQFLACFYFKLNDLSWLNTISIWSNMALTSGAKIEMSLRYSSMMKTVDHQDIATLTGTCLTQHLTGQKGIWANSYRPEEPALNVDFLMSSSAIANCKYPSAMSKEVKTLLICNDCRASSIWGKGNASLMVMEFNFL